MGRNEHFNSSIPTRAALDGFGRTVVSGTCRPVGFAGLALGGGFGVLSRQFGLALDRVVGFEVVLPSGAVVVADAGTNADLFWALRGGGHANFGVVTSFAVATVDTSKAKFQVGRGALPACLLCLRTCAYSPPPSVQFRLFSSKTAGAGAPAAAALVAWQAFAAASDRGTFTQVAMGTYQAGEPSFAVMVVHNGSAAAIDGAERGGGGGVAADCVSTHAYPPLSRSPHLRVRAPLLRLARAVRAGPREPRQPRWARGHVLLQRHAVQQRARAQ